MGKVIKILSHILSATLLMVIAVPIFIAMTLSIPLIQSELVNVLEKIASDKLETKIDMRKISFRPFNGVVISDFLVSDQETLTDTIIFGEKVSAEINLRALFAGKVELKAVTLRNGKFYVMQQQDGTTNFKKVIEKLKNPDAPEREIILENIRIENLRFKHRKLKPKEVVESGVNFDDLDIESIYARVRDLNIFAYEGMESVKIEAKLDHVSFREKSGLQIDRASGRNVYVRDGHIEVDEFKLESTDSDVKLKKLILAGESWDEYQDFINKVRIEAELEPSRVGFRTIGFFAPPLLKWNSYLWDATAKVQGTVEDMSGVVNACFNGDSKLDAKFAIKNVTLPDKTQFDLYLNTLQTNLADIERALEDAIEEEVIDSGLVRRFDHIGNILLTGQFKGSYREFETDIAIDSNYGTIDLDIGLVPSQDKNTKIGGSIYLNDFDLGSVLKADNLGKLSVRGVVDGEVGTGEILARIEATIIRLELLGYSYSDIVMNGNISNKLFVGSIVSGDENIEFDFDGILDFNATIPKYDFTLDLKKADLVAINIIEKDSVSVASTKVKVVASGTSIEQLNGEIVLSDLFYANSVDTVRGKSITIVSESSPERGKRLTLRSSFIDADYRSRSNYVDVVRELETMIKSYMPKFYTREQRLSQTNGGRRASESGVADAENYSLINIDIKETNNITSVLVPGLMVASGSSLSLMFNPATDRMLLSASSDYIEYKNNFASELDLEMSNSADSISLFLHTDDIYVGSVYMPEFSVIGSLRESNAQLRVRFNDKEKQLSALMGVTAIMDMSAQGTKQIRLRFTPSTFTNEGKVWNVASRSIVIDTAKVVVNGFMVSSGEQQLEIDGTASRLGGDTLKVDLKSFDLGPLSKLTGRAGYYMKGEASGGANIISMLETPILYADIRVEKAAINNVPLPDSRFMSRWSAEQRRAGFMLTLSERLDTVLLGVFNPVDRKIVGRIKFENTDLSLLDPLFKGIISETKGEADINLSVSGELKRLNIQGGIDVRGVGTRIDFLNTRYEIAGGRIDVDQSRLVMPAVKIMDDEGNSGSFEVGVDLSSFSNIKYRLDIQPQKMKVIDTKAKDNEVFYGRVYATGRAIIQGDKMGVKLDINAATDDNSEFYLPLSGGTTGSVADIITFVDRKVERADSLDYLMRKRMIRERAENRQKVTERANMEINMMIDALPNAELQLLIDPKVGDILRARGRGSLALNINPKQGLFTMYGDYQIEEGSYQFTLQEIISKKFSIEQGSKITWTGEPADALLEVDAVYKLRASLATLLTEREYMYKVPVNCHIMLRERLSQPEVTFRVDVPDVSPEIQAELANAMGTQEGMSTQFFFLLMAHSFYTDDGSGNIGASGGTATAFEFLNNQINTMIASDVFQFGVNYTMADGLTEEEVGVNMSLNLVNNRLLLEVEGNVNTGRNEQTSGNLSGDFSLTWLIDRTGNLRAKGFSRTINRYDENQGLQESGVGLSYREEFNTGKDIVQNFRNRFTKAGREHRRQKREERKQIKEMEREERD